MLVFYCMFFFKQKTAYEMRISDWSSDVCSSDLPEHQQNDADLGELHRQPRVGDEARREGTDKNAREQITRDRRDFEPVRERPHQKGDAKPRDDGSDQRGVMRHGPLRKGRGRGGSTQPDRKSTRLNSSH